MAPEKFVKQVVKAYNSSVGVFSKKVNAEDLIPPKMADLEKSLYLFYVIQLDYAIKSSLLYAGAKVCMKSKEVLLSQNTS